MAMQDARSPLTESRHCSAADRHGSHTLLFGAALDTLSGVFEALAASG